MAGPAGFLALFFCVAVAGLFVLMSGLKQKKPRQSTADDSDGTGD
jgi:hypothetical protein